MRDINGSLGENLQLAIDGVTSGLTLAARGEMRFMILAFLATPLIAVADPAPVPPTYVRAGLFFGIDANYPAVGLSMDGGRHVGPLWVHAQGVLGGQEAGEGRLNDHYTQLRAGAEVRACTDLGGGCFFAGVDAGYRWLYSIGDHDQHDGPIVMPRVGFDTGWTHVRAGLALEGILDQYGVDGFGWTLSIGYRF